MSMNISFNAGNLSYTGINTNSAQYKAAKKMVEAGEALDGGFKTKEQQLIDEIFGGKEARIRNWMRYFDSDGDYINPVNGLAGLDATGKNPSEYQKMISIPESSKDEMFEQTKEEFLRENGILNGDTTKRSDVYTNMYKKVQKNDRLAAGYTMQQYERAYRQAFLDAARKADPKWEIGKPVPSGALDGITRESVEANLRKSGSSLTSVDMKI